MKHAFLILILLSQLLLLGCAAHTNLEPAGNGKLSANFNIGGPIVKAFGARVPIPYATAGANYGLNNKVDLNGNLHLFSLPYRIFGLDFGPTWYPFIKTGKIPTIGIQPRLLALASLKSTSEHFKIYPIISSSAAWEWNSGLVYFGTDVTIPLSSSDYDEEAATVILSPFLGYKWTIGKRTHIFTEIKWHGANVRADQLSVEYLHPGNYGALSTLFSIQRSF